MLFREQKIETGWQYDIDDVFGSAWIKSSQKLDADTLDSLIMVIMKHEPGAGEVNGSVEVTEDHTITYYLKRTPIWSEDDEPLCENSRTLTQEQAGVPTTTALLLTRTFICLRRFVSAFREAWRKSR